MTRQWAPGDVAMVQAGTSCARLGLRNHTNDGWRTAAGLMSDVTCPEGAWHRPLVVVDPQDHDELWHAFQSRREQGANPRRALREALDALANPTPPRPPEPIGLGAVVVDRDGSTLVRVDNSSHPWRASGGHRFAWEDVEHLTTLADGVEPMADWEIDLLRGVR